MATETSSSGGRRMLGHASIYALGNVLRQLAGFLMLPVYTRYLTPADYGIVGLMIFAISLIELVFGARLSQAVPKYYFEGQTDADRAKVVSTAMIITGVVSAGTASIMVLLREPISQGLYGTSNYATIVAFFSVQILTQALEYYALVYLRLQQRPWFYISVNLAKLVVQLSLNIWLVVFLQMGVMGVAVSAMVSSSIFALLLSAYLLRHIGWSVDRVLAGKMVRFCWPLWLAGFAGLYIGSANRYYLRIFSSLDDVGLFELAVKFSAIISVLVWDPFATYWQVERFKYYQRGNAEGIFQIVFYCISTLLVLAALGVALFAGPVIRIMADPAFHASAKAVPFVAFGVVFSCLVAFSNFSFLVKEKTGWIGRNNYLTAAIITVLNLALIPIAGFVGAALATMLAMVIQFIIVHYAARRFYDMGISLKHFIKIIFIALVACLLSNEFHVQGNLTLDVTIKILIYTLSIIVIFIIPINNLSLFYFLKKNIKKHMLS